MFIDENMSSDDYETLMDMVGNKRQQLMMPAYNVGMWDSDYFDKKMLVMELKQKVESNWKDKNEKVRDKYVGDVMIEMGDTTLISGNDECCKSTRYSKYI